MEIDAIEPYASTQSVLNDGRRRWVIWVALQILLTSGFAAYAELLIYDEMRWYRIDRYDALVWGMLVTQLFVGAYYLARYPVRSYRQAAFVLLVLFLLAGGLTLSAIFFLYKEAMRSGEDFPIFSFGAGHMLAVFLFLLTLFLQLRLAMWILMLLQSLLSKSDSLPTKASDHQYSMIEVFVLSGLCAAVFGSSQLLFRLVSSNDTIRLMGMFYFASLVCFFSLLSMRKDRIWKQSFVISIGILVALSLVEIQLLGFANRANIPVRFSVWDVLVWNMNVYFWCWIQLRIAEHWLIPHKPRCDEG